MDVDACRSLFFFFFQAEDGIRDLTVTGVQTCALPICGSTSMLDVRQAEQLVFTAASEVPSLEQQIEQEENFISTILGNNPAAVPRGQIGRASCRERV